MTKYSGPEGEFEREERGDRLLEVARELFPHILKTDIPPGAVQSGVMVAESLPDEPKHGAILLVAGDSTQLRQIYEVVNALQRLL